MSIWDKKISKKEKVEKIWLNKLVLGIFLFITIATVLMKIIDGILLDLGYGINGKKELHMYYWIDKNYLELLNNENNNSLSTRIKQHPNTLWFITQFTWITTIFIIIVLIFRFFQYDDKVPKWLKWIMTQRTLSLIVIYDLIVAIIFWSSIYTGKIADFNKLLKTLQMTYTIFAHAIIPILIILYSLIYIINDSNASYLKEMTIWKGIIYPIIYLVFYFIIAMIWYDPYSITNLNENIIDNIWKFPATISIFIIFLSIMVKMHNYILVKFNKRYDPKKDYENETRKKIYK